MAHSFRRPYISPAACKSERADKKIWHGRMRAQVRTRLRSARDLESFMDVDVREVSNPWAMGKDGPKYRIYGLVVRRQPRALRIVCAPTWLPTSREVYKLLSK